jgi:hypothetical protein
MADERPENTNGKGDSEGSRDGRQRDASQGRKNGKHRGFRGRHGAKPNGAKPNGADERQRNPEHAGSAEPSREEQGQRDQRPPLRAEEARDIPACPLCGKPVYDLSTALSASRETGEPAHFDCVLERVQASETLAAGEKIVYLGSGSFGVVTFKDKGESSFAVQRRIQWEKEGEKKDWRRGLSSRITNL